MDNISYAIFRTIRAHVRILIESLRKFIKKCSNPRRVVEYQESALGNVFDPNARVDEIYQSMCTLCTKRAPRNLFLYFTLFSFFVFFLDIILGGIIQHNVKNLAAQESKTTGGVNFEGGNSVSLSDIDRISSPLIEVLRGGKAGDTTNVTLVANLGGNIAHHRYGQNVRIHHTYFRVGSIKYLFFSRHQERGISKKDGEAQDTRTGDIS